MWYLWQFRWDEAKFVWLWVAYNIIWTLYNPIIISAVLDEVTFVSVFRETNPGQSAEGVSNVLSHNGMWPDSTVYRCASGGCLRNSTSLGAI